jgi:hypothetical protein
MREDILSIGELLMAVKVAASLGETIRGPNLW